MSLKGYIACDTPSCPEQLQVPGTSLYNRYWRSWWIPEQDWLEIPPKTGQGDKRQYRHYCPNCVADLAHLPVVSECTETSVDPTLQAIQMALDQLRKRVDTLSETLFEHLAKDGAEDFDLDALVALTVTQTPEDALDIAAQKVHAWTGYNSSMAKAVADGSTPWIGPRRVAEKLHQSLEAVGARVTVQRVSALQDPFSKTPPQTFKGP